MSRPVAELVDELYRAEREKEAHAAETEKVTKQRTADWKAIEERVTGLRTSLREALGEKAYDRGVAALSGRELKTFADLLRGIPAEDAARVKR